MTERQPPSDDAIRKAYEMRDASEVDRSFEAFRDGVLSVYADAVAPASLTEFLLARIAEDELAAREATDGPWWYDPTKINSVDRGEAVFAGERGLSAITVCSTGPADDWQSMVDGFHIARHDPARVLADCEAKREIVRRARRERGRFEQTGGNLGNPIEAVVAWETAVRALAAVYSDHPDYREEWR